MGGPVPKLDLRYLSQVLCHFAEKIKITSSLLFFWLIPADPGCSLRGDVETQQMRGKCRPRVEPQAPLEDSSRASGSGAGVEGPQAVAGGLEVITRLRGPAPGPTLSICCHPHSPIIPSLFFHFWGVYELL